MYYIREILAPVLFSCFFHRCQWANLRLGELLCLELPLFKHNCTKAQTAHSRFEVQNNFEIRDSISQLTNQLKKLKTCIRATLNCYELRSSVHAFIGILRFLKMLYVILCNLIMSLSIL